MNSLVLILIFFCATIYGFPNLNSSSEAEIQTRIFNGKPAKRKEYPFMARLHILDQKNNAEFLNGCSGVLVSDRHILTAAHCFYVCELNKCLNHIIVVLGDVDIKNRNDQNRKVFEVNRKSVIIHKQHNIHSDNHDNDIAIITLPEKVTFNDYIKPANLPKQSQSSLMGKTLEVAGWGMDGNKPLTFSQRTRVEVVGHTECYLYKEFAPIMQLCLKGKSKITGTCMGDSGGPFVIKEKSLFKTTWTVVGLSSYASKDCTKGHPEVMTSVHYFLNWIHEKTGIKIPK